MCFFVKFAKFLTPFFTEEFGAVDCQRKPGSSHRRCSIKGDLKGPAQVFACEYCEIFKNTYFEKHLRTAASENQHLSDKFTEGR